MRFLLMTGAGMHIQGGKIYRAGEIVTSDSRLDKLLKNKFLFLDDPKKKKKKKVKKTAKKRKTARKPKQVE